MLENGTKYDWGPEQAVPSEAAALLRQGYYAAVSYVDEQVGKILAELEALKMSSTIVAFTSDRARLAGSRLFFVCAWLILRAVVFCFG